MVLRRVLLRIIAGVVRLHRSTVHRCGRGIVGLLVVVVIVVLVGSSPAHIRRHALPGRRMTSVHRTGEGVGIQADFAHVGLGVASLGGLMLRKADRGRTQSIVRTCHVV